MSGIFAKIFGMGNTIEKGFELINNLHTSTEEEINALTNAKVSIMASYAPFKIAQRYLAVLFTLNFIFVFWVSILLWATGKDFDSFVEILESFKIGWIMLTIVGFYFGGGAYEGILNSKNKNKST